MKILFYAEGVGVASESMAEGFMAFLILQSLLKAGMKIDSYQIFICEIQASQKQVEKMAARYKKQMFFAAVDETAAIAFANTSGLIRLRRKKIKIIKELSVADVLGMIPADVFRWSRKVGEYGESENRHSCQRQQRKRKSQVPV